MPEGVDEPLREKNVVIREAGRADIEKLQSVLTEAGLSTDDLLVGGTRYWLAEDDERWAVGAIGLELGETAVLLRSAAVIPLWRDQGLGASLVQRILDATSGYQHIYLFSTGAGEFWQRLGFVCVPVPELVAALPTVPQVKQYKRLGWLPTEVAWRRDLA